MRILIVGLLTMYFAISAARHAFADVYMFTPGDILVSFVRSPNSTTIFNDSIRLAEYTLAGAFVQEVTTPFTSVYEDVGSIVNAQGRVHIYYQDLSTGFDYLSTLEPKTGVWQTHHIGNPTQGDNDRDLSISQNYLFQREARVDLRNFDVEIFDTGLFQGASEVSVGLDQQLYAVSDGFPQAQIQELDPISLQRIGAEKTARGESGQRLHIQAISAAENGDIFVAARFGWVYHFNSDLQLLNYRQFNLDPDSLKLSDSGAVVMGDRFGRVVVTDTSLTSVSVISVGSYDTYADFIPMAVPEPTESALSCVGALLIFVTVRHKRTCSGTGTIRQGLSFRGNTTRSNFFSGS